MGEQKPEFSLRRISACPVHFLWDGRGSARSYVRFGFMGILLAAILMSGNWLWPTISLKKIAEPVLMFAFLIWCYGQIKSFFMMKQNKKAGSR